MEEIHRFNSGNCKEVKGQPHTQDVLSRASAPRYPFQVMLGGTVVCKMQRNVTGMSTPEAELERNCLPLQPVLITGWGIDTYNSDAV